MTDDGQQPILLTGSSGFLGAWVLKQAVAAGQPVVACDRFRDSSRLDRIMAGQAVGETITWRPLDVTDGAAVAGMFAEHRPRAVIHLAALQIPDCAADPRLGAMVNVIGHLNVLEAARDHGAVPVVYGSSIAAKPRGTARAPDNLYGVYKKTDEEIARLYWQDHGVPSMGLRPHIVYGIGRDRGETAALTLAMRAAALGEAYEIPFRGRFSFQYAADVAAMFLRCATAPMAGALLSDLSARVESVDDVVAAIQACVPDARIAIADRDRIGPTDGFDVSAVKGLLGDGLLTDLETGVRQTIEAFRQA
jgi:nucleoside-diphosphate-sugar epimerase